MKFLQFIISLFAADSGLSSKRFLSYLVAVVMLVYIFIHPVTQIVWILASLVAALQGLTLFNGSKNTTEVKEVRGFKSENK